MKNQAVVALHLDTGYAVSSKNHTTATLGIALQAEERMAPAS